MVEVWGWRGTVVPERRVPPVKPSRGGGGGGTWCLHAVALAFAVQHRGNHGAAVEATAAVGAPVLWARVMLVGQGSRGRGGNPARGTLKSRDVPEGLGVITAVVRRRLVGVRVLLGGAAVVHHREGGAGRLGLARESVLPRRLSA